MNVETAGQVCFGPVVGSSQFPQVHAAPAREVTTSVRSPRARPKTQVPEGAGAKTVVATSVLYIVILLTDNSFLVNQISHCLGFCFLAYVSSHVKSI